MGRPYIVLLVFFCSISFVFGCGEPKPKRVNWQDAMQVWFSNSSVRPTEPPRDLWTRKDEELFLRRIGFADIVAIGTVRVVTLFSSLGADQQVGLAFRPIEVLHGSLEDQLSELWIHWKLVFGVILILTVLFVRGGIDGFLRSLERRKP